MAGLDPATHPSVTHRQKLLARGRAPLGGLGFAATASRTPGPGAFVVVGPAVFRRMLTGALAVMGVAGSLSAAAASWTTHAPATAFIYAGHPIDPRCAVFDSSWEQTSRDFDLRRCTRQMRAGPPPDARDNGLMEAAFPPGGDGAPAGYAQYAVVAAKGRQFLLNAAINTGGTGIFDVVLLARKAGRHLFVRRMIRGGDRCNGGIVDVQIQGDLVRYSVQITPRDVIALTGPLSTDLEKGLEASALNCVATMDMEYHLATGTTRFVALTLTGDLLANDPSARLADREGWTERFAYQHCFNAVYNSFVDAGRTGFAADEAYQFAQGFTARCVSPKAQP